MTGFVRDLRERLIENNPLFAAALGMSGVVVFTRTVADALAAAITALAVVAFAVAISGLIERFTGRFGSRLVFFASATTAAAVCGAVITAFFPPVWAEIGACFPLFAVGSLALTASRQGKETMADSLSSSLSLVLGYDAALILVSVVRQMTSHILPAAGTSGGALIIAGLLAAAVRATYDKVNEYKAQSTMPPDEEEISDGADVIENNGDFAAITGNAETPADLEKTHRIEIHGNAEDAGFTPTLPSDGEMTDVDIALDEMLEEIDEGTIDDIFDVPFAGGQSNDMPGDDTDKEADAE